MMWVRRTLCVQDSCCCSSMQWSTWTSCRGALVRLPTSTTSRSILQTASNSPTSGPASYTRYTQYCVHRPQKHQYTCFFSTGWAKKRAHRLMAVILSNLNQFRKKFTGRFPGKFAVKCKLKIPPHLACVARLPCETLLSSDQLRWLVETPSRDLSIIEWRTIHGHDLVTINRWRTVVSGTWKYDDPSLNMSHEGAARGSSYFHVPRTTVCHMFCRLTNYKNGELYVSWNHFCLCICMI